MDIEGNKKDHRRAFNTSERVAMFLASNGKCSICGCELRPGWHADHIRPYSKGGETDVINGQALCPKCNLKKGNKIMKKLRHWQERAIKQYSQQTDDSFLCVACPGAGKTTFALAIAAKLDYQIIVVCPTSHLKRQWADSAEKDFNIKIDSAFENRAGFYASDVVGVCTTYHAVAFQPDVYRNMCSRKPTIVILDEVHHVGEQKTWGEAVAHAFEPASRKLLLSGTPFRSDNNKIPFVKYDNNTSVADFVYNYEWAQADNVCRPINFPKFDGEMKWVDRNFNEISHSFSDDVTEEEANNRLRTALEPDGGWLKGVLIAANDRLSSMRNNGHKNAGGLVLARDNVTSHANDIAQILKTLVDPKDVVIATSDQENASEIIKAFKNNGKKWLVAVKMVSEGVDIPRLRVGVHATNVTSELFFRQAVGRIARYQEKVTDQDSEGNDIIDPMAPGDDIKQESYYYIPKDKRLEAHAEAISNEVIHEIDDEEPGPGPHGPDEGEGGKPRVFSFFEAISSTCEEHSIFSDTGKTYTVEELEFARSVCNKLGFPIVQDLWVADVVKEVCASRGLPQNNKPIERQVSLFNTADRKDVLRRNIKKFVNILSKKCSLDYNDIHVKLNTSLGLKSTAKGSPVSEEQLQRKLDLARDWYSKVA